MPYSIFGIVLVISSLLLWLSGCIPRPVSIATPTPGGGAPDATPTGSVIEGNDIQLPLAAPLKLHIQDRSYDVTPVEIHGNQWRFKSGQPDTGQWVYGTLINYVIGLEATAENKALFEALTEADTLKLVIANGKALTFQFLGRQLVDQSAAPNVFQQVRPGLTLALLGDDGGGQRLVITAGYVLGAEPTPPPDQASGAGASLEIDNARITLLSSHFVRQAAELPSGYAYYLVDFSVKGLGAQTLDASMFQMDLVDSEGKRYAVSIPASQAGAHGPAGGQLSPGQALTATAGYLVPQSIPGPRLTWQFGSRPGMPSPASFQLMLAEPTPVPDPRWLVRVQIDSVGYSQDLSEILISGGIGNPTDQLVTLTVEDVTLENSTARMPLSGADPAFPWNIAPGESRAFTLHYPRMAPGSAILHILHWSFELRGLQ